MKKTSKDLSRRKFIRESAGGIAGALAWAYYLFLTTYQDTGVFWLILLFGVGIAFL